MTTNFKQEEFACKCGCGEMRISPTVVLLCQLLRNKFKKSAIVLSGCRCKKHNTNVGGAVDSLHMPKSFDDQCHAADIYIKGIAPIEMYIFLDELFPTSLGLGVYKSWIHVDDRMDQAYRWDKR